jgi:hypothetical protein
LVACLGVVPPLAKNIARKLLHFVRRERNIQNSAKSYTTTKKLLCLFCKNLLQNKKKLTTAVEAF